MGTFEAKDQNFIWQFNVEEGWFATIPRNGSMEIPDEDYRFYVGDRCQAGIVTREMIKNMMDKEEDLYER